MSTRAVESRPLGRGGWYSARAEHFMTSEVDDEARGYLDDLGTLLDDERPESGGRRTSRLPRLTRIA